MSELSHTRLAWQMYKILQVAFVSPIKLAVEKKRKIMSIAKLFALLANAINQGDRDLIKNTVEISLKSPNHSQKIFLFCECPNRYVDV